ncbi:LacI family DNA-binding transcriptional regulator [Actinomyces sp. MRS3W]|uniref:LacI family DNA-binding transcriptional regulator n=1 Tax=Actinomyces sp. MRS3W TaxID=2800796 RepID=UPI0028FD6279|nr:substrate-binding domain-containing protein [Actinomyces sp. MRS3W]MDU0349530.1 substrate-binding domain-containing protein [Actinomyces sp. MRS3W]
MSEPTMDHHRWGMVLARPRGLLTAEPFWSETADGIEEGLQHTQILFFLHQVPGLQEELEVYRRWSAQGFVHGVILVNPLVNDPRPALVDQLGLASLHAGVETPAPGSASIVSDNVESTRRVLERLHALGHTRIARVSGPSHLAHTHIRNTVSRQIAQELGISVRIVAGEYSEESGRRATAELLGLPAAGRPTAIIYDNDTMALAGLATASALGMQVPDDVSLVAWDDSASCQLASPPITAIAQDVHAFGRTIAQCVRRIESGESSFEVPEPAHHWLRRASVAEVSPPR